MIPRTSSFNGVACGNIFLLTSLSSTHHNALEDRIKRTVRCKVYLQHTVPSGSCMSFLWGRETKNSNNHQDLSGVCVYKDVLPTLFAHGAAVHPADLPIRPIHLFTHPADFPITPRQPHTLLTVIRPTCSLRLTAAHRCAHCVRPLGYCS